MVPFSPATGPEYAGGAVGSATPTAVGNVPLPAGAACWMMTVVVVVTFAVTSVYGLRMV